MDTLTELLESSSKSFGGHPALVIKPSLRNLVWSYADLWNDSGRVASFLQDKGVKKGDRILLWGPNMPQWVVGFFGAVRIGAVPVPLDPGLKASSLLIMSPGKSASKFPNLTSAVLPISSHKLLCTVIF